MGRRELHPVLLVGCLALIAVVALGLHFTGVSLHRAQQLTALVTLAFFLVVVLLSPLNGLVLLFLLPPLFNGEHQRPYFWLFDALVSLTLAAGVAVHLWRRRPLSFPHAPFLLLFLLSTIVSFPLNLKELWLQLQVQSWRELLDGLRHATLEADLYYVRTVLDVASGIGLYVVAVNHPWTPGRVLRLATAACLLQGSVTAIGLALSRLGGVGGHTFLTLMAGRFDVMGGFAALGFNVSYFAQYAVAYLPFTALVVAQHPSPWLRGLAAATVPLVACGILLTHQRGAYLVLLLELALLGGAALWGRRQGWVGLRPLAVAGAAALAAGVGLLAFTPVGPTVLGRIRLLWESGDPYRATVLGVAWEMFRDEPLLGVGAGRYAGAFLSYRPEPDMLWGSLSAHSLYAQLLAEQGVIGLAAFVALVAVAAGRAGGRIRHLGDSSLAVACLGVSLAAWLAYGALQYTLLLRSMQVYFWLALALVAALSAQSVPRVRPRRAWTVGLLALVLLAAGMRGEAALTRPIPAGFARGLHDWRGAGGIVWTRGGAVLSLPVAGPRLRLGLACPVAPLIGRPQTVSILLDGAPVRRVVLDSTGWTRVDIPVSKPIGSEVVLGLQVAYTFTPAALGIGADVGRFGVLLEPIEWVP